ncbi:hypothetical protein P4812_15340, partial [Listeria monocytogenes]|nr:hypothetical protein [Listeria monocytogenes]
LQDYESSNNINPKMVVLDAGRFQVIFFEFVLNYLGCYDCSFPEGGLVSSWGSGVDLPVSDWLYSLLQPVTSLFIMHNEYLESQPGKFST